jgi:hypothetical protein
MLQEPFVEVKPPGPEKRQRRGSCGGPARSSAVTVKVSPSCSSTVSTPPPRAVSSRVTVTGVAGVAIAAARSTTLITSDSTFTHTGSPLVSGPRVVPG